MNLINNFSLKHMVLSRASKLLQGVFLSGLFLFFGSAHAATSSFTEPKVKSQEKVIGQIQFVIGQNVKVLRNAQRVEAKVGTELYVNDELITGLNSFIHSKMSDGALISIRPQSHLQINCYQDNAEKGDVCLKFTLLSGQVRKVSGEAGKENPEKYRLNTPVAAIGIRGTDYIASVKNNASLVKVVQGAITVSPFVENCKSQGFGACHTSLTKLLTEYDTYMLRIQPGQAPEPIAEDIEAYSAQISNRSNKQPKESSEVGGAVETSDEAASETTEETTEETTVETTVETIAVDTVRAEGGDEFQQAMRFELPVLKDNPHLVDEFIKQAKDLGSTDLPGEALPVKKSADLVFGTWHAYNDGISLPYELAKEGREPTVGDSAGALWRKEGVYRPLVGKVDYSLSESHAYVAIDSSQVLPAEVVSGSMQVDFDANRLNTKMTIEPEGMRRIVYVASHDNIRSDGVFAHEAATGRVGEGAISNDGSEVGYRLKQAVERGVLHADTIWRASP